MPPAFSCSRKREYSVQARNLHFLVKLFSFRMGSARTHKFEFRTLRISPSHPPSGTQKHVWKSVSHASETTISPKQKIPTTLHDQIIQKLMKGWHSGPETTQASQRHPKESHEHAKDTAKDPRVSKRHSKAMPRPPQRDPGTSPKSVWECL